MITESSHSNQCFYLTGTKKHFFFFFFFVEANARNMYAKYLISYIKQTVSEMKIFKDFFQKFAIFGAPATNQNKRSG